MATPDWLRKQAAFAHYEVPREEKIFKLAKEATDMDSRLGERYIDLDDPDDSDVDDEYKVHLYRENADFIAVQYDSIKKYYRQYIASPAYSHEYSAPTSCSSCKVLLEERLGVLPNLNHVRFVRPPIVQTPFHEERYAFWMDKGLDK